MNVYEHRSTSVCFLHDPGRLIESVRLGAVTATVTPVAGSSDGGGGVAAARIDAIAVLLVRRGRRSGF
jgi:hypothetical protein